MNSQLRKGEDVLVVKKDENKDLKMELFNNAQRLMSNYYARLYYNRLTYRFKQWKQNMINMKHREFLMKKFIDHARGNKWYMVKAAF